ncbi:MAG: riboflavin synthase [Sphaerobacter sp.]|nr:riboflavin synthase [Sphaerobacter sp.]
MFSGIVEEIGTVAALGRVGADWALTVRCRAALEGTRLGDSIAVNGVCLTVAALGTDHFVANLQPVTLRRTNLGDLRPGSPVNLERAVAVGERIGGHYVQGHVDDTGRIVSQTPDGAAVVVRIAAPPEVHRYLVPRGFIAVDGASLTVVEVLPDGFTVSLVTHTQQHTTLAGKRVGERVNLEVDVIAKYVERLLGRPATGGVDLEQLRRAGFA